MTKRKATLASTGLVIRCAGCGHCAPLEAAYREYERMRKAAKAKPELPREPEPPPAAVVSREGTGTLH